MDRGEKDFFLQAGRQDLAPEIRHRCLLESIQARTGEEKSVSVEHDVEKQKVALASAFFLGFMIVALVGAFIFSLISAAVA